MSQKDAQLLLKRVVAAIAVSSIIVYEIWRWYNFLLKPSTYAFSIPFVVCESIFVVLGNINLLFFAFQGEMKRDILRLRDKERISFESYPTVDIMIPTYSEPTAIVRETLLAVINLNYTKHKMHVYVLDDGGSREKQQMVEQISIETINGVTVRYIGRKKTPGVPHHAKAGNINNALFNCDTNGELVVVFDCDMIAQQDFLQATVPHFYNSDGTRDENCAMVQTPQSFSNISTNDPLGQQYLTFYGPGLMGWDTAGSTPCCGTNVVFSRNAFNTLEPKGFQYGSITEDFLTSLTMHASGLKSKYVREILATGLAPETYSDFFKQRFRWAAGGLQIFFFKNPLLKYGLTKKQKFLYFTAGLNNLLAIPMAVMMVIPSLFLIAQSTNPELTLGAFDSVEYAVVFMIMVFFNFLTSALVFGAAGYGPILRSIQEAGFIVPCFLSAISSIVFCRPLKFTATPKDKTAKMKQELGYIIPNILFYLLSITGLICGLVSIVKNQSFSLIVCMLWILFTMWQVYPPISEYFELCRKSRPEKDEKSDPIISFNIAPESIPA